MQKQKNEPTHNKMGTMPVGRLIVTMSWPAILSMFIQAFYNVVDSFFVSRIGEEALAALTYVAPIQFLLISVAVGTGVGINSLISRRLGAGMFEEANLAACHGYRLGFFNWVFFAIIGLLFSRPIMDLMSNNPYRKRNHIHADSYHRLSFLDDADNHRKNPSGYGKHDCSHALQHRRSRYQHNTGPYTHLRYRTVP